MNSKKNNDANSTCNSTSTPKRRRLGTRRILSEVNNKNDLFADFIRPQLNITKGLTVTADCCDSPPLPCNQVEYLSDSGNNTSDDINCQSDITESCFGEEIKSFTPFSHNVKNPQNQNLCKGDVSDELFTSKLEDEVSQNNLCNEAIVEKHFRDEIAEGFEAINQSISIIKDIDNCFETKDSFLLDIPDHFTQSESNSKSKNNEVFKEHFYQLPMVVKGLFKTYRNIEKLYDWQEECLNLDAIQNRNNLIYALPTSGGKTLVAEILMLREVINRKHNVLFILPFVAIVQEKIWSLSPFALQLNFLVEEYAAGKGHIPPKKRRAKNSIYIATIEKGLALVRSLIELDRLHEIGLIVVDELHLIGEEGRGATLESLLTIVKFANRNIQIVGMSATIGNLEEIAEFLEAAVYQREFRPVELTEYVKIGDMLHRIVWGPAGMETVPERQLHYDYTSAASRLDPDRLGGLVAEVVPAASCLIFCPTQHNAESVAMLLCKMQRKEMLSHRVSERAELARALAGEGAGPLAAAARCGLAYHHAGLSSDERSLLENAFRSGVISVLCCTSTLAAGVNLPARRVIVRAPRLGRAPLTLPAYRQMAGRAGRAGVSDAGESILICGEREWSWVRGVVGGRMPGARSVLCGAVPALLLSGAALRLAPRRADLVRLLRHSLLAVTHRDTIDLEECCDAGIRSLVRGGALEVRGGRGGAHDDTRPIHEDTELAVSKLGRAAIIGCMELGMARQFLSDLETAGEGVVLGGALHLLYLVAPHEPALRPDYRHYHNLYTKLGAEGVRVARALAITDKVAVKMITGKPITDVPEQVLNRFYVAMMLYDLWKQVPFAEVADKYCVSRGAVQAALQAATAQSSCCARLCEALCEAEGGGGGPKGSGGGAVWAWRALLAELAPRLQHCAAPQLQQFMELPNVRKARARQLLRAGYKRVEELAKSSAEELVSRIEHLSRTAATHLISAARMMLIEKVENLRAEAEEVMDELKTS
ncbi:PREDICTED: helicase POLQ-like [Papilio xuthus]|uniref:Helicase POLQ-like n=1 Tax=Papilio xuthus TaxID=66420 RepID=A0AAJ6YYG2_PAPXU|nr:PREDICTED: helicase POLQ-like [Papilio xuthus]